MNREMLHHHHHQQPASVCEVMKDPDYNLPAGNKSEHQLLCLPKFRDVQSCMWTASHAANCPSEDRSASLVNLLLQPLPPNFDSETQLPTLEPDYKTLIRLNLWAVIDGHGGGCVATYGSEVLLPHIAASVSRALGCAIVDRGVCTVNGQLRDANALDLDGLIQTSSDRSHGNPNSIHYQIAVSSAATVKRRGLTEPGEPIFLNKMEVQFRRLRANANRLHRWSLEGHPLLVLCCSSSTATSRASRGTKQMLLYLR